MSNAPESAQPHEHEDRDAILKEELERRLQVFAEHDDADFGRFTHLDWAICTVAFFLLPLLIAWLAA